MTEKVHYTLKDVQDAVRRFHIEKLPTTITPIQQMGKVVEECSEYLKGYGDRVKRVDAIGDAFYALIGVAVREHVDLELVFNQIHQSNMTKTNDGTLSPKGATYVPPEHLRCLACDTPYVMVNGQTRCNCR